MTEEEIVKLWNMGLTKFAVAKRYMGAYNEKANRNKEVKRMTERQALQYVEPILFRCRMEQLKEGK